MTSPREEGQDESLDDIRRDEENAARPAELYHANVLEYVCVVLAVSSVWSTSSSRVYCTGG